MTTAYVLTPYTGTGSDDDPYQPLVGTLPVAAWRDVTAAETIDIVPVVNLLVVLVTCSAAVLASIYADSRFEVLYEEA